MWTSAIRRLTAVLIVWTAVAVLPIGAAETSPAGSTAERESRSSVMPPPVTGTQAAVSPMPAAEPPAPAIPTPGDYVIGKQDLLQISVFQLDSLNQTLRVQEDGSISMPLVGDLEVAGMTRRELEKAIAERLSPKYVINPQVTVFVKEFQSKKVSIIGAVKRPGSYEVIGTRTLLEMVSLAEGVLKEQAGRTIQIIRRNENGLPEAISISYAALEAGDPAANITIRGGDLVHVPIDDLLHIYVNGAVRRPDMFRVKRSEPVTVLQAITRAGGINERGSERRVQVLRQTRDGRTHVIPIDLRQVRKGKVRDLVLQDNDVVVVPEAYF
jgi:polysaccharide export outer membrane protein